MATLSKNGSEVERFELLKKTYSVRSNGHVMKNEGFGWKRAKLRPGANAETFSLYYRNLEEKNQRDRPCFIAYREAVKSEFPLSVRWQYLSAVSLLGDDIDGIWSELNDHARCPVDLETLEHLMRLRQAVTIENQQRKGSSEE
jgi:hypothetical protein